MESRRKPTLIRCPRQAPGQVLQSRSQQRSRRRWRRPERHRHRQNPSGRGPRGGEQHLADVDDRTDCGAEETNWLKGRLVQIAGDAREALREEDRARSTHPASRANQPTPNKGKRGVDGKRGRQPPSRSRQDPARRRQRELVHSSLRRRERRVLFSTARQSVDRAREQLSEARQQADALDDVGGVSFRTPEMKQKQPSSPLLSVVACEGNLPSSSQTTMLNRRMGTPSPTACTSSDHSWLYPRLGESRRTRNRCRSIYARNLSLRRPSGRGVEPDFPQTDRSLRRLERASKA